MWQAKVKADYEAAGGEDAECNQVTVKEIPDKVEEVKQNGDAVKENVKPNKGKGKEVEQVQEVKSTSAPPTSTQTPKEKIRNEWYQSNTTVTIEIFAKGVPKDAEVDIQEGSVRTLFSFLQPYMGRRSWCRSRLKLNPGSVKDYC